MKKTNPVKKIFSSVTTKAMATLQTSVTAGKDAVCTLIYTDADVIEEFSLHHDSALSIKETNLYDGSVIEYKLDAPCLSQWYFEFATNYPQWERYYQDGTCKIFADKNEISQSFCYDETVLEALCISCDGHLAIRRSYLLEERIVEAQFPYWAVKPFYDQLYAMIMDNLIDEDKMIIQNFG